MEKNTLVQINSQTRIKLNTLKSILIEVNKKDAKIREKTSYEKIIETAINLLYKKLVRLKHGNTDEE